MDLNATNSVLLLADLGSLDKPRPNGQVFLNFMEMFGNFAKYRINAYSYKNSGSTSDGGKKNCQAYIFMLP